MKYVGITRKNKKQRWNNGNGYTENQKFYKDIQKYGWDDGFTHEIIQDNLSYSEARRLEKYYISKYNSVSNGYNKIMAAGEPVADVRAAMHSQGFDVVIMERTI